MRYLDTNLSVMDEDALYPFTVPAGAVRPPESGPEGNRAFVANLIGAVAVSVNDRIHNGMQGVAGRGAHAPAAIITLLWYPDRPVGFLAERMHISHSGAVQLAQRLETDGLVERIPADDRRSTLLALTDEGQATALNLLAARREVITHAVSRLSDEQINNLANGLADVLFALTSDLPTSEHMCRMCDELACPDARCPVEIAEPSPRHRRGLGYGVGPAGPERSQP